MLEKVKNLISAVSLKVILDLICISYLCETYVPFAFKLELNAPKIIQSYFLLLLVVILIPTAKTNISSVIIWLFIAIAYIPSLTVYGLGNESPIWIGYITLFWLLVYGVLFLSRKSSVRVSKIIGNKESEFNHSSRLSQANNGAGEYLNFYKSPIILDRQVWFWIIFILGYTYLSIATLPTTKFAIDFTDIYDVRANFKPILPFAGYLLTWAIFVINPFLIVYFGFIQKDVKFTAFSCASQLFLYVGNGQKTTLFSIPVLLIIIFFWSKGRISFFSVCSSIMSLLIAGWLSFVYLGDSLSSALFASRILVLPAMTDFYYYDFFVEHPPILLAHGNLGFFIPYKFDMLPWYLIGQAYLSNPNLSMNSGMLGDSYMNFKEFGLVFNSIAFAMLLIYVDKIGFKKNQSLILACTLMPFIWCLNGSLYSMFTSGGMGIGLLIVSRISNKNDGHVQRH